MRKGRKVIITLIVIIVAFLMLERSDLVRSVTDRFRAKPVVIDETPILIRDIKSIGQLITYTFYDEVVADSNIVTRGSAFANAFNHLAPIPLLPSADKQLVLIGKGKVLAGTDLTLLTDTSLTIRNDTATLVLPKAKIIDAIINPSDFEIFIEKGQWSNAEVTLVKLQARHKIEARALQQSILEKADAKAKKELFDFLVNLGYKKVVIY